MAGYSPTILELTTSDRKTSIPSVLDLLERRYDAELRLWPPSGGRPSNVNGVVSLGDRRLAISVQVAYDLVDSDRVNLSIELEPQAYEAAYDIFQQRVRQPGKRTLIAFCIDVATALRSEGFRLCFLKGPRPPLTVDELVKALTSVEGDPGLVSAIASASPRWMEVKRHWPSATEMAGFRVVEFIGPEKE